VTTAAGRRLTIVVVSPRVAPGLLSLPAWEALRAGPNHTLDPAHPQLPALAAVGVRVEVAESLPEWGVLLAGEVPAGVTGAEVIQGSWDLPGARLLDAVAVMDRLRSPGGCPWDAEQTHASLMPYLLEEAYEAYQALEDRPADGSDDEHLREELGDVLLQVLFHARLGEENLHEPWSVDDVAVGLVDKLVARHPHVFGDAHAPDAETVNQRWEELKAAQKGRGSVTDGIPLSMAALALAAKLQRRAAKLGVPQDVFAPEGLGGALWWAVDGQDAETALRVVARDFRDRLAAAEARARAQGREPASLSADEWPAYFS
jgi:XTP/dITP diphosphohydrolase